MKRAVIFSLLPLLAAMSAADAAFVLRQSLPSTSGATVAVPDLTYILEAFDQANAPLAGGYAFGNVPLPESNAGTIRVTNQGTGTVILASAALTGDPEIADGTGASPCSAGMTLAPATSCVAYPVFTPSGAASYSAQFAVTGDHGAAVTVNLAGAGTTTIALNAFDTTGNPLTGAVDYGDIDVGQVGAFARAGEIRNTGTGVAVLQAVGVTGNAAFSLLATGGIANCGATASLAAGQYCNVYATFAPTAVGPATADYTLTATGGQTVTVGLTGSAAAIAPTLGTFTVPANLLGAGAVALTPPTTNSSGAWSYSSSNTAVATVSGGSVTIGGAGSTTITATQAANGNYTAGSKTATLATGYPTSCKTLRDSAPSKPSGNYVIDPDGPGGVVAFSAYCDMVSSGGGWTKIVWQDEVSPVAWTGGVSGNSFALTQAQIPAHTQVGFGKDNDATAIDYANFQYTTGNIARTLVSGLKSGPLNYHIHRDTGSYYAYHNPDDTLLSADMSRANTLTFDRTWGRGLDWAFSPDATTRNARGYAMQGIIVEASSSFYAWSLWVR